MAQNQSYAAADIFACGESFLPRAAAQVLIDRFEAEDPDITEVRRGLVPTGVSG